MYKGIPTLETSKAVSRRVFENQSAFKAAIRGRKNISLGISFGENPPPAVTAVAMKVSPQAVTGLKTYCNTYKKYLPYIGAGAGVLVLLALLKRK